MRWTRAVAAVVIVLALVGCSAPRRHVPPRPSPSPFPVALPTRTPPPAAPLDGTSQPLADPLYPEFGNPVIDVLRYELALDWQPGRRWLTGTATLHLRMVSAASEVRLDFSRALTITKAEVDGAIVTPARQGDRLALPAGRALAAGASVTAVVQYEGSPTSAPFPGVRTDVKAIGAHLGERGELWSMQEPYGAYTWFPCSDHPSDKALYDVAITAPAGWAGVSSGRLVATETGPAGRTTNRWHATEPIATYVVAFAVGPYTRHDLTGPAGVPITLWVPADFADMLSLVRQAPDMLSWLAARLGPYPFSTAGVVIVPDPSAMETQTMVTMGLLPGSRGQSVLLHELAHQWFGDAVAPRTWRDLWLNEGFAIYFQMLWEIDRQGADLDRTLRRWWDDEQDTRRRAGPAGNYDKRLFGEHNVYYGPGLMLHELRRLLGDPLFFAMAHDWVQHHRHTNQDRASFTSWASAYTGRDLAPIIDKWLDSPTVPPFPG
jgi:aminopeptidase N